MTELEIFQGILMKENYKIVINDLINAVRVWNS